MSQQTRENSLSGLASKRLALQKMRLLYLLKTREEQLKKTSILIHLKKDPMKSIELNAIDNASQPGLTMKLNYLKDIY